MCTGAMAGNWEGLLVAEIAYVSELNSMCARPVFFSPVAAIPSHARPLAVYTPREDPLADDTAQYQSPRCFSPLVLVPLFKTPSSSRSRHRALFLEWPIDVARERRQKLDVLSHLPPEAAVRILFYLQPKDLCQVCQVCWWWYQLAEQPHLRRKRRRYIQMCKEEYIQSKENVPPGTSISPQRATLHSTHRFRTTALSPLSVIQSRIAHLVNTPTSPSSALLRTPGPAYLLEDVKKLSLDEEGGETEVRRQLFPEQLDSTEARTTTPQGCKHDLEGLVGKKSNRVRLRRL